MVIPWLIHTTLPMNQIHDRVKINSTLFRTSPLFNWFLVQTCFIWNRICTVLHFCFAQHFINNVLIKCFCLNFSLNGFVWQIVVFTIGYKIAVCQIMYACNIIYAMGTLRHLSYRLRKLGSNFIIEWIFEFNKNDYTYVKYQSTEIQIDSFEVIKTQNIRKNF